MASSFVPVSNTKNGFTIVTQVVPGPPGKTGSNISTPGPFQRLLKGEPKALGTVQIMIGITTLLFGIGTTVNVLTVSVVSGVNLWGPIFYIISGALSIAVGNKAHPCVVKASLTMNVFSSVAAGIAITVLSISLFGFHFFYSCYAYNRYDRYDRYERECATVESLSGGMNGGLLVLALLEFIISICSSAFACSVSCCSDITDLSVN
ncbi:membrane-spanning 4-domains subfamily A member 4A-like [Hoplias malabaricus]|uniref:membrane-spanning 4-domains subfamily A member 4A-like n=1 Tax=Hoplias malabaricus TaxID=27720 RepID=UPI003461C0EE